MNPREMFTWAAYGLGVVVVIIVAALLIDATIRQLIRDWRATTFYACGVLDHLGRPCYLPANHRDHEHATQWQDMAAEGGFLQARHRYDDTTQEGRLEWRRRPGSMSLVTASGEPAGANSPVAK